VTAHIAIWHFGIQEPRICSLPRIRCQHRDFSCLLDVNGHREVCALGRKVPREHHPRLYMTSAVLAVKCQRFEISMFAPSNAGIRFGMNQLCYQHRYHYPSPILNTAGLILNSSLSRSLSILPVLPSQAAIVAGRDRDAH
jgi:hypothetical protein